MIDNSASNLNRLFTNSKVYDDIYTPNDHKDLYNTIIERNYKILYATNLYL